MKQEFLIVPGLTLLLGVLIGLIISRAFLPSMTRSAKEGFSTQAMCNTCNNPSPCGCPSNLARPICPPCREPDLSKYVLKTTIPPCAAMPDLSKYMLKTECPPVPDLSRYVLKSSVPKPQPIVLDCSKCTKPSGECPPCPRPRCPEVKCPPPTSCPAPAPCPRQVCPSTVVKCKAEDTKVSTVRPFLAPLDINGFGRG